MAKSPPIARRAPRRGPAAPVAELRSWCWITDAALLFAIALVAARMLMSEPFKASLGNPLPGTSGPPLGPGPATGLWLDLLCWLPAFAVLIRQLVESRYTLRFTSAFVAMGALGVWAVASMAWSADRFTAIVSAFHLLSAMILLWAVAQSSRSWLHVRCVAGIGAGLLLALAVRGYTDHFVDQPMVRANWASQKEQVMRENHWTEDSFDFQQFQRRVLGGQEMGFSQSPNTYAGLLVLLGTVSAGLVLDRPGERGKSIGILAAVAIVAALISWTQCRAAYVTPVLTAACLAIIGWKRRWFAEHAKRAFIAATAAIIAGFAGVVGYGMWRGNLIHSSLTFRWWYWIGAARIIKAHPLLGVGWGNFGASYLGVRLPIASEEILDPHNFIVRFFAELGAVGGVLLLAWLLLTAWKLTAGAGDNWQAAATDATPTRGGWPRWILAAPILAILINLPASVDFTQTGNFITLEITSRVYWLVAMVAGMGIALLRREPAARGEIVLRLETAPAPWAVCAMVVGLAIFLLHNLIEFGIFEPGPMLLVALLSGTALGIKIRAGVYDPGPRRPTLLVLLTGVACWIAAIALLAAPITAAEGESEYGDALIRAGQITDAQAAYESAARLVPYNSQYPQRAAYAAILRYPRDRAAAMKLLGRAIVIDPLSIDAYLTRAHLELLAPTSPESIEDAIADDRKALSLDPNNMRLHLELANLLDHVGRLAEARSEFSKTLELDADLERGDPKRLSPAERAQARARLAWPTNTGR